MRLPGVLTLMVLILLGGVIGVEWFGAKASGAAVPGVVIVDLPRWDPGIVGALRARWPELREERVPAGTGPIGPFDEPVIQGLDERGHRTIVYDIDEGVAREALGEGWDSIMDAFPAEDRARHVVNEMARFLRSQHHSRPFVAALLLGETGDAATVVSLLEPVEAELRRMPWFRRCSLVLLGPASEGLRPSLRLDLGDWGRRADDELADLLDPRW